jgi:hypothetical protein
MRLSLWGYPDEVDKRGPQFWRRPLIGLPPAAALGSLASVALSSGQARQFYQIVGRIRRKISYRFLLDATIPISFRFLLDATRNLRIHCAPLNAAFSARS